MILVDTSVVVAWMDPGHPHHQACVNALKLWAGLEELAVSVVTYAELAAGGRTREAVDEQLETFVRLELDFPSAWRAGRVFRQTHPAKNETTVLPDFLIRAQAAMLGIRHLTNDRRRLAPWPDVDFLFPEI